MRTLLFFIGIIFICPAFALPKPTGPVILTFTGVVSNTNSGDSAQLDKKMLEALPQHSFTTSTPWLHSAHQYSGVSAVDLLKLIGGEGTILRITALNQYVIDVPVEDFAKRHAIFAIERDGEPISIRNLGPILVMYPFDDYPELKKETYYWRAIWQVASIKVLSSSKE